MEQKSFDEWLVSRKHPVCGRISSAPCDITQKQLNERLLVEKDWHGFYREVCFAFGPDSFDKFKSSSHYDMLITCGLPHDYVYERIVNRHRCFVMFLIEKTSNDLNCSNKNAKTEEDNKESASTHADWVVPATWAGVGVVLQQYYPGVVPYYKKHLETLKQHPFPIPSDADFKTNKGTTFFEADSEAFFAGQKWADVMNNSKSEYFASYARFQKLSEKQKDRASVVRFFLYCTICLQEQFRGDGFTYNEKGEKGVREYLIPNRAVKDFSSAFACKLNVHLPSNSKVASAPSSSASSSSSSSSTSASASFSTPSSAANLSSSTTSKSS